jgi:hypothetical protein
VPVRVRPAFVASDFDVATYAVVASIADATSAPTPAPTPAPTKTGFTTVEEKVETEAVVTAISFPLTLEEASNKVMQTAMTGGIASSLGLAQKDVTIAKINGNAVRSRSRRLAGGIDIEFNIVSTAVGAGAVAKLSDDVKAAASDGALVANIQKKANAAGVLVASLKSMPRVVVVTTSTVPVTITVTKQVATTPSPTPGDNSLSSVVKKSGLTDGEIAGIVVGVVAFVSILAVAFRLYVKTQPKPEGPVKQGNAESALAGAQVYSGP